MTHQEAFDLVKQELDSATRKYGKFQSAHEGYAIILEELDELFDEIKNRECHKQLELEVKQVAAMAIRFLIDCC